MEMLQLHPALCPLWNRHRIEQTSAFINSTWSPVYKQRNWPAELRTASHAQRDHLKAPL
jgi:hypothetical protein